MDAIVKEYIDGHSSELVSVEELIIFIMGKGNTYTYARELADEHKGVINTYAIAYLKRMAGAGGRNSGTYTILLKEYMNNKDELSTSDKINIHIDLNNKSKNKIEVDDE